MALTDSIKFWEGWFSDLELEVSDEQKKHLENAAIEQEAVNARAKKASDKIKASNKRLSDYYDGQLTDINKFKTEYSDRIAWQRSKAQDILKRKEADIWLEAQIQAAKAWTGWKLSAFQMWKINRDITDSFSKSVTESKENLALFESQLDERLNELNFSTEEKAAMIQEAKKLLSDAEAKPFLDALIKTWEIEEYYQRIRTKYTSDKLTARDSAISGKREEQQRIDDFTTAWKGNTPAQNEDLIQEQISHITTVEWFDTNKLVQAMLKEAQESNDPWKLFAAINKYRNLDEQKLLAFQTSIWTEATAEAYYNAVKDLFGIGWEESKSEVEKALDSEKAIADQAKIDLKIETDKKAADAKILEDIKIRKALLEKEARDKALLKENSTRENLIDEAVKSFVWWHKDFLTEEQKKEIFDNPKIVEDFKLKAEKNLIQIEWAYDNLSEWMAKDNVTSLLTKLNALEANQGYVFPISQTEYDKAFNDWIPEESFKRAYRFVLESIYWDPVQLSIIEKLNLN